MMKRLYRGLLLVILIALLSAVLHAFLLNFLETLTIGIVLGIIFANAFIIPDKFDAGITFALKKVLKWGIVLLGVRLNLFLLLKLGPKILGIVLCIVTIGIISAYYIGKSQNLNTKLATLLGVGSCICGASAIIAMGPVIEAEDDDVAISVSIISFLGAVGVIIYSFVAKMPWLTDLQYGIWAGSSLQGVAHALAAAGARGADSSSIEIGTLVKMSRVALLAPLSLILGFIFSKGAVGVERKRASFPKYVLYFILVSIIFSLNSQFFHIATEWSFMGFHIDLINILNEASNFFVLVAMVAMGLKVDFKSFAKNGLKALTTCGSVFLILSMTSLALIFLF